MFQSASKTAGKIIMILKYSLVGNTWLWFHMLFGSVAGRFARAIELEVGDAIVLVLCIALSWEVIEYISDHDRIMKIYGSYERYVCDTIGDVVMAIVMAFISM